MCFLITLIKNAGLFNRRRRQYEITELNNFETIFLTDFWPINTSEERIFLNIYKEVLYTYIEILFVNKICSETYSMKIH